MLVCLGGKNGVGGANWKVDSSCQYACARFGLVDVDSYTQTLADTVSSLRCVCMWFAVIKQDKSSYQKVSTE